MADLEQIVISTNTNQYELAPAVLTVLEEAGPLGLESRSYRSPIADAVCKKFNVSRSSPIPRGSRPRSEQPDVNIEYTVTYLVTLGCVRIEGHNRFITARGRQLLKMPLVDIYNAVKVAKKTGRISDRELEIQDEMVSEEDLESLDDEDMRLRRFTESVVRIGQFPFRWNLIGAYQGRCAITNFRVTQVLEAAHIRPYRGPQSNRVDNGLLLRLDLHRLFDKNLIGIEPATRVAYISKELIGTEYKEFSGRQLAEPKTSGQRPSEQNLAIRWKEFHKAEEKRKEPPEHEMDS
jgi:hypothetical protein